MSNEEQARAFLARLLEIQEELKLTNSQFAREIGSHPSQISHLRAGRKGRRLTLAFAIGALRRFPELDLFLRDDLPIGQPAEIIGNSEEGTQS